MNVLIMAQGQQRRLPNLPHPKHLLYVGGEPIITRTLRLLRAYCRANEDSIWAGIVGSPFDFAPAVKRADAIVDIAPSPAPGSCIVDGLLGVRARWTEHDRNVILLGDVVWSQAALAAVLGDRRRIVFAGTSDLSGSQGEVFALAFAGAAVDEVETLARTCPCRIDGKRPRVFTKQQGGHLRRLLWWTQESRKLKLAPRARQSWHPDVYLPIDDWTDDVDTPLDVAALPELARQAELEARGLDARAQRDDAPGG